MGVKNFIKKVGEKAGDKVANLSSLSPVQLEEVQAKREEYLLDMPKPDDELALEITEKMMAASSIEILNAYLPQIKELYLPIDMSAEYDRDFDVARNIRYINITKWVTDKNEKNLEKLVNVYAVLSNEDCNIALVFNRTREKTNVYLAVVNAKNADSMVDVEIYKNRIVEAIRGNFPGAEWDETGQGIIPCLNNERSYSVASASNIPTEKSKEFISQTIEKLLDGVIPESKKQEYTIVLLATPIRDVEERKLKLSEFYSGLIPYSSWQTNYQYQESEGRGSMATIGINVGASAGIQNGNNYSQGVTDGTQELTSHGNTESESNTDTKGTADTISEAEGHSDGTSSSTAEMEGTSDTVGGSVSASSTTGVSATASATPVGLGASATASESVTVGASADYHHGQNRSTTKTLGKIATDTLTKTVGQTISNNAAKTTGTAVANTVGKAVTKAMSKTSGITKATNFGANVGANFAKSSTVNAMIGKNEGITQTFGNHNVKHALELLDNQMKRLEQSTALGLWDFAAYVLSEDQNVANNVAHSYLALTLGEDSYMSKSAVNLWRGNVEEEKEQAKEICNYIRELRHPLFGLNPEIVDSDPEFNEYPSIINATTSLSGKELAYSLNFPQKSVAGLPVFECASFGRNISKYSSAKTDGDFLNIGNIFHMNHKEETPVNLSVKSLASHTFVTGSTGTGKSNTIYQILDKLEDSNVKFMVIEPAKGEYKRVFGGRDDVNVFGTNPLKMDLLQINPFSFPEEIHVLEHIDRLVEILNACWPMYAAMPAVLKDAIEQIYIKRGWNMKMSTCLNREFPTFNDLLDELPGVMETSLFSADTKSDYAGALITRVKSLTNGINGQILTSEEEIPYEKLFDENTIIDISRIGSMETKALYMGIIVMKLQEYRMQQSVELGVNQELKHITVLEEAHNLLRKTSYSQAQEGANLQGKSVEMITNAIAEMRTYGEGFVIADQSPAMLDEAVIRNTNTKIVLRLPDGDDRELVGKSAALNDDQIQEIAKIPTGVAMIYQNDWIEAVLCKIDKYDEEKYDAYTYDYQSALIERKDTNAKKCLEIMFGMKDITSFESIEMDSIKKWINNLNRSPYTKTCLYRVVEGQSLSKEESEDVIYNMFDGKHMAEKLESLHDEKNAINHISQDINNIFDLNSVEVTGLVCKMLVDGICRHLGSGAFVDRYRSFDWRNVR